MSEQKQFNKTLDMELFTDQKKVSEYLCPLCTGVYFNPVVDECGHVFCKECIRSWFNQTGSVKVCPIMKTAYPSNEEKDIIRNLILIQEILEKLEVKCKNDCGWKGLMRDMMKHLENECLNGMTKCSNSIEGCDWEFLRSEKESHEETCEYKTHSCVDCEEKIIMAKMNQHLEVCPKIKVECTQGCSQLVERNELENHFIEVCDMTEMECGYSKLGCEIKAKRKDVILHSTNELVLHTELMAKYLVILNEKVENLSNHSNKEGRAIRSSEKTNHHYSSTYENDYKNKKTAKKSKSQSNNNNGDGFITKKRERSIPRINNEEFTRNRLNEEEMNLPEDLNVDDIDDSPLEIDTTYISKGVTVNGNRAVNESSAKNLHKFVFANLILNNQNIKWRLKINKKSSWMAFGCSIKEKVVANNYKFMGVQKSHGCFMLSTNGYSWNTNSIEENNCKLTEPTPEFEDGDVVTFQYRHLNSQLIVTLIDHKWIINSVNCPKDTFLVPTVIFLNQSDDVSFTK